ncbi:MAG: hypothetical protein U1D30_19705, partial [Planctomycetota bacterium]
SAKKGPRQKASRFKTRVKSKIATSQSHWGAAIVRPECLPVIYRWKKAGSNNAARTFRWFF